MNNIDNHDVLKQEPFTYKVTKSNKTLIYYNGKQIMMLSEKKTKAFLNKIKGKDPFDVQMVLAKITGNFKRGNERRSL